MQPSGPDRQGRSAAAAPGSLDGVLDEHAEVRELIEAIQAATDRQLLSSLFERLRTLFETHFAREESADGMLESTAGVSREHGVEASALASEHRQMMERLRRLSERLQSDSSAPLSSFENEIADFLAQVRGHEAREADLLADAVPLDRADPPPARASVPAGNQDPAKGTQHSCHAPG